MRACWVIALALGVSIGAQAGLTAEAAKKYYPPGFTPPADQPAVEAKPPETSAPPVVVPGGKQVIIKTVAKPAPPRDPLLVLLDEHRYYDALRLIESRLKGNPGNASLQLMRGQVLRLDGNFEEALEQYQSVLDKHKNKSVRAGTWNGLGWTYYRKALYERQSGSEPVAKASLDSAEHAFRQVFSLEPRMAYAWAGLGQVQLAQGKMTEAEGAIKRALQYGGSGNTTAQLARAELLLAQKKPEEALQMLYRLKKTVTREPQVFLLLAHASLETGKVDDAIINLKQLLALMPEHTDALRLLSHSYERKMKHQDAEQALEKAIAINPGDEKSVELLLKIYDQRNEQERPFCF